MESINFETRFIRNPLKLKSDNWQDTAHKWEVTINGQVFDYYTGLAHRKAILKYKRSEGAGYTYDELKNKNLTPEGFNALLALSTPTQPKLDDVLYSLVIDADANNMSFKDWCANYGHETDSRKAFRLYEQCQENGDKLRLAKIDIEAEKLRLENY